MTEIDPEQICDAINGPEVNRECQPVPRVIRASRKGPLDNAVRPNKGNAANSQQKVRYWVNLERREK